MEQLLSWWRNGCRGVCALVGIGGAGKTAILDRLLYALPEVTEPIANLSKDTTLQVPKAMFVYSFFDRPEPDEFFSALADWLDGGTSNKSRVDSSAYLAIDLLRELDPVVLLLDGFEQVQAGRGHDLGYGQITDRKLRDFIVRVANGFVPGTGVIITTRFPIGDLEESDPTHYQKIEIDELPLPAAANLLRIRGVSGTEAQLTRLAKECGQHALTLDLIGSYIAHFANGKIPARIGASTRVASESHGPADAACRRVLEMERRLVHITDKYRKALLETDPAALALLERTCLFRVAVPAELLARVFTGPGKESVSGRELAELDAASTEGKLLLLTEMRLVDTVRMPWSYGVASEAPVACYSVHAAVRDAFLAMLKESVQKETHKTVGMVLKEILTSKPAATHPSDPQILELLTEAIYHSVRAGDFQGAWELHVKTVGGFANLGRRLGAFSRGERLVSAFASDNRADITALASLPEDARLLCLYDWGRYLLELGRLEEAERALRQHNEARMQQGNWLYAGLGLVYLSEILMLGGRLHEACIEAGNAIKEVEKTGSPGFWRDCHASRGYIHMLLGNAREAERDFEIGVPARPIAFDFRLPVERKASWLIRNGRVKEGESLLQDKLLYLNSLETRNLRQLHACKVAIADFKLQQPDIKDRETLIAPVREAHDWAAANDARELLCMVYATCGRSALAAATAEKGEELCQDLIAKARQSAADGIRVAMESGYALHHSELLLLRARAALLAGDATAAERDARVALYGIEGWSTAARIDELPPANENSAPGSRGILPPAGSGWPSLLAATNDRSGDVWNTIAARVILIEATLLRASGMQSGEIPAVVDAARAELKRIIDWNSGLPLAALSPAYDILQRLDGGKLTPYQLRKTMPEIDKTPTAKRIFISYSHADKRWLERLREQFAPFVRSGRLVAWDDAMIATGAQWREEIKRAIDEADVAVLLVSTSFIASPFITENELPPLLNAAKTRGLVIAWVPITATNYEETELKHYQAVHDPKRPLKKLRPADRDEVLVEIARKISRAIA
jgi:tetratricopeptide (TPR) repeat protein